jgi:hypothetical protein
MLTNSTRAYHIDEDIDFIHNYYENLVLQEIMRQSKRVQAGDRNFMGDVACVALNRLPPRYIRHDVDMTFFLSPQDMQEIEIKITNAVTVALLYVEGREAKEASIVAEETVTPEIAKDKKITASAAAKKTKK